MRKPLLILTEASVVALRRGEIDELRRRLHGAVELLIAPFQRHILDLQLSWLRDSAGRSTHRRPVHTSGNLLVDEGRREAYFQQTQLRLSPSEFEILLALVRAGGVAVTKDALMAAAHEGNACDDEGGLKNYISRLRGEMRAAGADADTIRTIHGYGYILDMGACQLPDEAGT